MDCTLRTRSISSLIGNKKRGKISLKHKLQRPEGQWNKQMKSDLIDSLLRNYPVDPTRAIKENDILYIIDGVQRISTLWDYCVEKGGFTLSENLNPVIIDGVEREIAGKKFSQLDEEVRNALLDCEIQIYELTNCTEQDQREIFRRQNSGKSLSNKQMRSVYMSDEFIEICNALASLPLMDKIITNVQMKNCTGRDIIIQSLMLMETNDKYNFTSFRSEDIDAFVVWYNEHINKDRIEWLKQAMQKLNDSFGDQKRVKIAPTSIPMILVSAYRVVKDKKSFSRFFDEVKNFFDTYDNNAEYKAFLQNGTSASANVQGRWNYWKNILKKISSAPVEETVTVDNLFESKNEEVVDTGTNTTEELSYVPIDDVISEE